MVTFSPEGITDTFRCSYRRVNKYKHQIFILLCSWAMDVCYFIILCPYIRQGDAGRSNETRYSQVTGTSGPAPGANAHNSHKEVFWTLPVSPTLENYL